MDNPKISIAIPIYYGEKFLKQTLDNILEQDFKNFEIIITDNSPGGEAEKIASEYSEKYGFIHYIKHKRNLGAFENWNSAIKYAKGEYFIFAGAHDLWEKNYLSTLYKCLSNNPQAVIAYAPSVIFKYDKNKIEKRLSFFDTSSLNPISRINMVIWGIPEAQYGLMRTDIVKKTHLLKQVVSADTIWIAELSLWGDFIVCNNTIRYRREIRQENNYYEQILRYSKTLFKKRRKRIFPNLLLMFNFWLVPFTRKDLKLSTKLYLLIDVILNTLLKFLPIILTKDIILLFKKCQCK